MGPGPDADLRLEPDAVAAITRDYLLDPTLGRRMEWSIECLDGADEPVLTDADLARRFRAVKTWIEDQSKITPLTLGEPNVVQEPYPVPKETFGWAAGDASYAMGALLARRRRSPRDPGSVARVRVLEPVPVEPVPAHLQLRLRPGHVNGGQVEYEPDGSWTIVVSARDPGHPNWVATQGHPDGMLWFRWFYPAATPDRPTTEVVAVGSRI